MNGDTQRMKLDFNEKENPNNSSGSSPLKLRGDDNHKQSITNSNNSK